MRRRPLVALTGGALAAAGLAYALERAAVRRWWADPEALSAAGRTMPADLRHHFVPVDDGGRLHVVERGSGQPLVLVHGVALGVALWVSQLRQLAASHRVVVVGQRGHGQSLAGSGGYSIERLADDLLEVLRSLEIRGALLVGHSMGGMVVQSLAVRDPPALAEHVLGLVLVSSTPGGFFPGPLAGTLGAATTALGAGALNLAERRGQGLIPQHDLGAWTTRLNFGARPRAVDVELVRSMMAAMSPSALHELLEPLLTFDLRRELERVELPTRVVVGSRDRLTPPRMARSLAGHLPGADLVVYPGCGHLPMLERDRELNELLGAFSAELAAGGPRTGAPGGR